MDGERSKDNQLKPREVGVPKETPEQLFRETLETTRQAMNTLVGFAIENGAEPKKFSHIERVFAEDGHILLPSLKMMRDELAKLHGETDMTRRTEVLTAQKTGEVFVPEEQAGSVHDVFHESIHRASWLHDREQGLGEKTALKVKQLAERYGVQITPDGKIDPNSEYINKYTSNENEKAMLVEYFTETLRKEVPRITEGLTEWATQRANGLVTKEGNKVIMEDSDFAYEDEVKYVNEIKVRMMQKEGITDESADTKLITAALTGDMGELTPYL